MKAIAFLSFMMLLSSSLGCSDCFEVPLGKFQNGNQHPDCYYKSGFTRQGPPTQDQDLKDHYWIRYAHEWGVQQNPRAPFVGAIVNFTSNELVCISVNMRASNDPEWARFDAHGELVVMENCSRSALPDIIVDGRKVTNPGWADMIMYGNIETCPMCAQAAIWRNIKRVVFGARASKLASKRCWTQSSLTVQEVADHSKSFFQFEYLRGPIIDYEDTILNGFPSFC